MELNGSVIALRADASQQIGTGHIMRSLTLADSLQEKGAVCHFVCRSQPGDLVDLIQRRGYPVHALNRPVSSCEENDLLPSPAHAAWLLTDQATDAGQTQEVLDELDTDWLIVDHYAIDARWQEAVRQHTRRLMVIDDLADRRHDCDLLLDHNLGREAVAYNGLVPAGCKVLAGDDYALLRAEFAEFRDASLERRRTPALKTLLVSIGGIDKDNNTSIALNSLADCPIPSDCQITVVIGAGSPWLSQLEQLASKLPWQTSVICNTDEMARIMSESDFAIGACGLTGLERACLGLPSIMLETADNQAPFLAAFESRGLAHTAPGFQYLSENEKRVTISRLFRQALNGENRPRAIASSCDGLGSARVAMAMAAF